MKKEVSIICRDCGAQFKGSSGSYRCPSCKKKAARYKAQREKMMRSLPFYLKPDA